MDFPFFVSPLISSADQILSYKPFILLAFFKRFTRWLDVTKQRAVVLACDRGLHVLPRLAALRVSGMFGRGGGQSSRLCVLQIQTQPPLPPIHVLNKRKN